MTMYDMGGEGGDVGEGEVREGGVVGGGEEDQVTKDSMEVSGEKEEGRGEVGGGTRGTRGTRGERTGGKEQQHPGQGQGVVRGGRGGGGWVQHPEEPLLDTGGHQLDVPRRKAGRRSRGRRRRKGREAGRRSRSRRRRRKGGGREEE